MFGADCCFDSWFQLPNEKPPIQQISTSEQQLFPSDLEGYEAFRKTVPRDMCDHEFIFTTYPEDLPTPAKVVVRRTSGVISGSYCGKEDTVMAFLPWTEIKSGLLIFKKDKEIVQLRFVSQLPETKSPRFIVGLNVSETSQTLYFLTLVKS